MVESPQTNAANVTTNVCPVLILDPVSLTLSRANNSSVELVQIGFRFDVFSGASSLCDAQLSPLLIVCKILLRCFGLSVDWLLASANLQFGPQSLAACAPISHQGCIYEPRFFLLRTALQDSPSGPKECQPPPAATNGQLPTGKRHEPPTAKCCHPPTFKVDKVP